MGVSILVIGDFRFPGGTSAATAHEMRALRSAGHDIQAVHIDSHVFSKNTPFNPALIDAFTNGVARLAPGDTPFDVDLVIAHNPMVFESARLPDLRVKARTRVLVVHQAPCDAHGRLYYDPWRVARRVERHFGGHFIWAPISRVCRTSFARVGFPGPLLARDWKNFLFPEEWRFERRRPVDDRPVVGRHGRVGPEKWPPSRSAILEVYPDDPSIRVRLLGVDGAVERIMQHRFPANWEVFPFGAINPAEFLRSIDFFVYYHHPDLVEAFGRAIAEAAASGAVVILPHHFEPVFGKSALYAKPDDVVDLVRTLHSDWPRYLEQSERGRAWISEHHAPDQFLFGVSELAAGDTELASPDKRTPFSASAYRRLRRRTEVLGRKSRRTLFAVATRGHIFVRRIARALKKRSLPDEVNAGRGPDG